MEIKGKDYLNELRKAVDDSEFNSDIAKKIREINKLADDKFQYEKADGDDGLVETDVDNLAITDTINMSVSLLKELDGFVISTIQDMALHIKELKAKFGDLFNENSDNDLNKIVGELSDKYKGFVEF